MIHHCSLRPALRWMATNQIAKPSMSSRFLPKPQSHVKSPLGCHASLTRSFSAENVHYYDDFSRKATSHNESHVDILVTGADWKPDHLEKLSGWGANGISLPWKEAKQCDPYWLWKAVIQSKVSPSFQFWLPHHALHHPDESSPQHEKLEHPIIYQVEYQPRDSEEEVRSILTYLAQQKLSSAIVCRCLDTAVEFPVMARGIATVMEATSGGEYIHLVGENEDPDGIFAMVKELQDLDVDGPMYTSRVVVDVSQEDDIVAQLNLEKCLDLGVNKVVVDWRRLNLASDIVNAHNKTCTIVGHND